MYEYKAKIVKIIDGDTFYADVDLGFYVTLRTKFRLYKVNTPELRTPEGKKVKQFVKKLLEQEEVILLTKKDRKGKYGRWLAEVLLDNGEYLSEILLEKNYAVPYKK